MSDKESLPGWRESAAKTAILEFVEAVTRPGASFVPVEERIATFDADGTLWCEKPMPVEADFILRRLAQAAEADPTLRDRQPWKAAHTHDEAWLGEVITEHYAGDDTKARTLLQGVGAAFAGIDVEDFVARADSFLRDAKHPTLGRGYIETAYAPMVDLLGYLAANGFASYMVSGSGSDFMRPITRDVFGIPAHRVIGSTIALTYADGTIMRQAELGFLDDGPQKPIQIWNRLGRRPILAAGNSNGDIQMLDFTRQLRLLVLHDDAEREFAYTRGAEHALKKADSDGWTVVSMKNDFTTVFSTTPARTPERTEKRGEP
jgi:phosphoglycolate phosphatase-like HAD superfamily hydrolase